MSVLSASNQQYVEDALVAGGFITQAQLEEVKSKAASSGSPFLGLLVDEGHISNEVLSKTIADVNKVPYVNLKDAKIDKEVLRLLPKDVAMHYMAVPIGQIQNRLVVAMLDADNVQAVDFLSNRIGRPLKVYTSSEEGIRNILNQYEQDVEADVAKTINDASISAELELAGQAANQPTVADKNIKTIVQDSPISKALSAILEYAAKNGASDIHIEPMEKELKIRCRIDGVLREIMKLPKSTEPAFISRIKILSNLKIDEHRIPQDGQFTVAVAIRPLTFVSLYLP